MRNQFYLYTRLFHDAINIPSVRHKERYYYSAFRLVQNRSFCGQMQRSECTYNTPYPRVVGSSSRTEVKTAQIDRPIIRHDTRRAHIP